jgi:protein HOOK3
VKKQLEFNNHVLTERLEMAEEQLSMNEATISELRDRIRELETPESPSTPGSTTPRAHGTFQRDFDEIGKREAQLLVKCPLSWERLLTNLRKMENDELKKEVEKLKVTHDLVRILESARTLQGAHKRTSPCMATGPTLLRKLLL